MSDLHLDQTSTPTKQGRTEPTSNLFSPITPLTSTQYVLSHPGRDDAPATSSSFSTERASQDDNRSSTGDFPSATASASGSGSGSTSRQGFNAESQLEVLNDDGQLEGDEEEYDDEDTMRFINANSLSRDEETGTETEDFEREHDHDHDEFEFDVSEPLVNGSRSSRGRRKARRRRSSRWNDSEEKEEKGLLELIPPLILAHPLPLLPLLALLPYNFLPAGVVFFVPVFCVLALLSTCAHIVIVYLAWYLKVSSFEEVFASVTTKYGKYGLWTGRGFVVCAVFGAVVSWIETLHPLLEPVIATYLPKNAVFSSRIFWTIIASSALLPSLLPSRMTRSLRRSPIVIALLLPIVAFLVIGRTAEIKKASEIPQPIGDDSETVNAEVVTEVLGHLVKRRFGLAGGSSAGAGLTTLAIFFSPHINTLPIHASLARNKSTSFPIPCLLASSLILILCLPLALVPYYLLPPLDTSTPIISSPTTPSGVFARLPADDGWVNVSRILMCIVILGSTNMWILRGRDTILSSMGIDQGERLKAGKWVGIVIWLVTVLFACISGWVTEKIELLGVLAVLAIGWFLPSLFFIITFHVRSPLSIIFPSRNNSNQAQQSSSSDHQNGTGPPRRNINGNAGHGHGHGHDRTNSLNDPSTDALLARKERQLQKRRLGRRLWQDLIVYIGILPTGVVCIVWTLGRFLGIW
ncbi:uncharacterized protein I303_100490 [Kwoniella dejecticola CBS 10117]|uniref:Solute carrier family 32 (Vesicular inhibitory amino acid transporter) n=1 Tax=Kwoniella dejecticola CBS 10117 TaxID=1296121 RepID=A0A1A6AF69_9TREE|nr:uncharacterized protein I303_00490 [Kwoniella dejecticola CBS 10117]OBR88673.1 hypothetical protein I303_00490 [Kwoniella dejecticola CBS 10117]